MQNPRQIAFLALRDVHRKGAFADVALDRLLRQADLSATDRRLVTELVYGSVRRQRSLDALIDHLGKKKAHQQPPDLRTILHLGLYQLRYQDRIPVSAAVNTTVQLAKENGFSGLSGFVNGLLRQYIRVAEGKKQGNPGGEVQDLESDPLHLPKNPIERLGILHSYPDWIIEVWLEHLGLEETEQLCEWMNQTPAIDLRVNPLRAEIEKVEAALQAAGISVSRVPHLPQALRLTGGTGAIQTLPGFTEGWWTVQDSSAQLVSYLLDPQPGEVVIDACAAPGGKTTHIAELMEDQGTVWACDKTASRLRKLQENTKRLSLHSIQIQEGDSRNLPQFINQADRQADRVLLDAPCSGLGTLHRHADARWRQTLQTVQELSILQGELLDRVATWVKPDGILVYATCTLHPLENEGVVRTFLERYPQWQILPPNPNSPAAAYTTPAGWIKVWPHRHQMDGFFMVRLQKKNS
ncbi:16S rRNA (cytosine(967)-C(5))-methyltransferase [Coleofasciculus sp. FACHB-1120]|uniref:16S rRNA (cytosine(967)-C(5))-methyltransferase n=1 Tax=Coleofasciculus sp. FACHB-1120 TaxID=2692783 RepID=UPI001687372D|nr:16S rRNA (cytosine(967)-C(5))-methyltransferase [Coleofasciculus sp. FACHB-1120]MBD2744261.1 16S rRNA (cytosine(967)-C(5))-methyltransferase [Coleofasciculus sp. FACHB-1120]